MGIKTKIEWCDSTINPIMGCTGCTLRKDHCYAAALCTRYAGHKGWPKSFDEPEFFPGRIAQALKWSGLTGKARPDKPWLNGYPRIIFVNDMGDGFCPDVDPDTWLPPQSLGPMAASPHIWLLLTKWPDRMRVFFERYQIPNNFWLGVSVENQAAADKRIPILKQTLAAVRFVSFEPLISRVTVGDNIQGNIHDRWLGISWAIVGGESGPGARPMHPDWAREIRGQCQAAGVPFFFKQWGAWFPRSQWEHNPYLSLPDDVDCREGDRCHIFGDGEITHRVSKHRAGCLLNGREYNDLPSTPRTQP